MAVAYHYAAALQAERFEVLDAIDARIDALPIVRGITDDARSFVAEQGMSVDAEGRLGYHVVDISDIPEEGLFGFKAYERRVGRMSSGVNHRLFPDGWLNRRLNLNEATPGPTPVLSAYFDRTTTGEFAFAGMEQSAFMNVGSTSDEGTGLKDHIAHVTGLSDSVQAAERRLNRLVTAEVADVLALHGLAGLTARCEGPKIQKTMRAFSDGKNLRMIIELLRGEPVLTTTQQIENMQAHVIGEREAELTDIIPSPLGQLVMDVLSATDVSKRVLADHEYGALMRGLDPERMPNDGMLTRIFRWAVISGRAAITQGPNGEHSMQFANTGDSREFVISGDSAETAAFDLLRRYLQHAHPGDQGDKVPESTVHVIDWDDTMRLLPRATPRAHSGKPRGRRRYNRSNVGDST